MQPEQTVLDAPVFEELWFAGFEQARYPGIAEKSVTNDATLVNHPEDGLAALALAQAVLLCGMVHLSLREDGLSVRLVTAVGDPQKLEAVNGIDFRGKFGEGTCGFVEFAAATAVEIHFNKVFLVRSLYEEIKTFFIGT